jgi:hypothetical protein
VRCDTAERALSERLDDGLARGAEAELAAHLATCPRCRGFERDTRRLRDLARLRPAGPVPDLVPAIMERVRQESPVPLRRTVPAWTRYAAAFVAGAVITALVLSGLPARQGIPPALATEIPGRIAEASAEVTSYRASFRVVERGFHPRVPRRSFLADVSFRAPERFAAQITDLTTYPGAGWPANDITLAVDGSRWFLDGPRGCPIEALPGCAPEGRHIDHISGRPPFDGDAPLPTDIILPVRMLAGSDRVALRGQIEMLGHDAVVVELAYLDAAPLFGFLHAGGLWRPFFPHDRVLITLDRETWFPLAFEVRAAGGVDRATWATGLGLAAEPAGRTLFRAQALRLGPGPDASWRPPGDGPTTRDLGFRPASADEMGAMVPADLGEMRPYRSGTLDGDAILSYTRGLSWLVIRETTGWDGPGSFGVGDLARAVRLPGGGVASYEPATDTSGRVVSVHTDDVDIALESNVPRADLLTIAGTLPVQGRRPPSGWVDQIPVARAVAETPFALLPSALPADYRPWAARLDGPRSVTVWFRRPGAEPGPGIVLHQAAGVALPPPLEGEPVAVQVRGSEGRYSPSRGLLEWVEDGVYRSLGGGALDLAGLLSVAGSLERPG